MTMPHERTRALRWGWEFLLELLDADNLTTEQQARVVKILRHYPSTQQIWAVAKQMERLCGMDLCEGLLPEDVYDPGSVINAMEPLHIDRSPSSALERTQSLINAVEFFHVELRSCDNLTEEQNKTLIFVRRHFPESVGSIRAIARLEADMATLHEGYEPWLKLIN